MKSIWALIHVDEEEGNEIVACYLDKKRAEKMRDDNIRDGVGLNFKIEPTHLVSNEEVLIDG